ncbi:MAG: LamG domain-containing protein [Candidatus Roizmanbacteria bacterium]
MHSTKSAFSIYLIIASVAAGAVFIALVLILINPVTQVLRGDDTKRRSDIQSIYRAIDAYKSSTDDKILHTLPLNSAVGPISISSNDGTGLCALLVPRYVPSLPHDPSIDGGNITDCMSSYNTGYQILRDSGGRFTVFSDGAVPRMVEGTINVDMPYAYFKMDELMPGNISSTGISGLAIAPRGVIVNSVEPKYGGALSFDGVTGYFPMMVGTQDLFLAGSSEFTLGVWVKMAPNADDRLYTIFAEQDASGIYLVNLSINNHKIVFGGTTNPQVNESWLTSTAPLTNNTWYHIEAIFSKKYRELYVNGARVSLQTNLLTQIAPSRVSTNQIYASIGKSPQKEGSDYFNGVMDDFRIYHYARRGPPQSNEVLNDMNNQ